MAGTPQALYTEEGQPLQHQQLKLWGKWDPKYNHQPAAANEECYVSLRFQGQQYDPESGLHYNRHRYYDPQLKQYISPDPIGLAGGLRPQGYVQNPLTWVDPLGWCPSNEPKVWYRTMSTEHFEILQSTGKVSATRETFTSPTAAFSSDYRGVLVKFTMKPGWLDKLIAVGVSDGTKLVKEKFPNMPTVTEVFPKNDLPRSQRKQWRDDCVLFKKEGSQINIGLGAGKGLDIFNENIDSFERLN